MRTIGCSSLLIPLALALPGQAMAGTGPGPDGRQLEAYAACNATTHWCRVVTRNLENGVQKSVKRFKTRCGQVKEMSIFKDTVAFVSLAPSKSGARKSKCRSYRDGPYGPVVYPASHLIVLGLKAGATQRTIARVKAEQENWHEFTSTGISADLVTWDESQSPDNSRAVVTGRQLLFERATGRSCELVKTSGTRYPNDPLSVVTSITLAGPFATWTLLRSINETTTVETFRQHGCDGPREKIG